jgi:preprotein translocase subunit SecA
VRSTLDVHLGGTVLRHKTTVTFGGEGLPLGELSNVATSLPAKLSQVTAGRQKVGRNDPCPCGSGRKFKKCSASVSTA